MKKFKGVVRRFAAASGIDKWKDEENSEGYSRGKSDGCETSKNISAMRMKSNDRGDRIIKSMVSGKPYEGGAAGEGRRGRNEKLCWFLEKSQEKSSFEEREMIGWVS